MTPLSTPAAQTVADAQAIYDWLREPDFAETFTTGDLLTWVKRRPSGVAARLVSSLSASPSPAAQGTAPKMTDAMMDAGQRYLDSISLRDHYLLPATFNWHEFWRAILAASPSPEALPASGVEALCELIKLRIVALDTAPRSARKDFAIEELRFVLQRASRLSSATAPEERA